LAFLSLSPSRSYFRLFTFPLHFSLFTFCVGDYFVVFTDNGQLIVKRVTPGTGAQTQVGTFTENYVPSDFRIGQNGDLYIVSNDFQYDFAVVSNAPAFTLGNLMYLKLIQYPPLSLFFDSTKSV
jgi:hypothetical protein